MISGIVVNIKVSKNRVCPSFLCSMKIYFRLWSMNSAEKFYGIYHIKFHSLPRPRKLLTRSDPKTKFFGRSLSGRILLILIHTAVLSSGELPNTLADVSEIYTLLFVLWGTEYLKQQCWTMQMLKMSCYTRIYKEHKTVRFLRPELTDKIGNMLTYMLLFCCICICDRQYSLIG